MEADVSGFWTAALTHIHWKTSKAFLKADSLIKFEEISNKNDSSFGFILVSNKEAALGNILKYFNLI